MISTRPLPRSVRAFFLVAALSLVSLRGVRADPVSEMGAFSVFGNVDLGKLKEVTTKRGPEMSVGRDLSVQSCYVVPGPPAKALAALEQWDASRHRELQIYVHGDLSAVPNAASFSKLSGAPENSSVKALVGLTQKASPELQLTKDEGKRLGTASGAGGNGAMPEPAQTFWAGVLAERAQSFASGGAARQPGYDYTGQNIRPGEELVGLLQQQPKLRQQFAGFLNDAGVLGGKGSLKKDLYFELIDVDDQGALTLGSFSSKPVGGGFQAADVTYYASNGYYVGITLYQMWPVDVGGQPSTLVWRGDMISAASLASLHGVEKLASESAMMKDITKAVKLLKGDMAGER